MNPKIMLVGGAVRDHLLGRESKDRDYVVVGANIDWMLAQGFTQVGQAFPVFLHPVTGEEYALARREKKVAPGYKGFEFEFGPHVTIEDDLIRRDLTINAMAMTEDGKIIDPFGGQADLVVGLIRHTSEAFAEDPLRVLRVARFAARYGFSVTDSTVELCKKLVDAGEIDALSNDRIWTEVAKMFTETVPSIALSFLHKVGAHKTKLLSKIMPGEFDMMHTYQEMAMMPEENMFFQLKLQEMTNADVEEFRLPTNLVRKMKFFSKVHSELLGSALFLDVIDARQVVEAFNSFRIEFQRGDLQLVANMNARISDRADDHRFFMIMQFCIDALLNLDFTEFVKTLKPNEIKNAVQNEKIRAVQQVLTNIANNSTK